MGRNRRRRGHRRWDDERESPDDQRPFQIPRHRNTPRTPPPKFLPSTQPDCNPFQHHHFKTNASSKAKNSNGTPETYHQSPYPKSQGLATRDHAQLQNQWKLQRHLKNHLVQALNFASQSIELFLPDTGLFNDPKHINTPSDIIEDGDKMDWQPEKEFLFPRHCTWRHLWAGDLRSGMWRPEADFAGFNKVQPPIPKNAARRESDEMSDGNCWSS